MSLWQTKLLKTFSLVMLKKLPKNFSQIVLLQIFLLLKMCVSDGVVAGSLRPLVVVGRA